MACFEVVWKRSAERELRNRLSYLGGRLVFTSERSDYWWWLMVSGNIHENTLSPPPWLESQAI